MSAAFDTGDKVRLKATFTDTDTDVAVDPDTVVFRVRSPDGTLTDYTFPADVINTAVGEYHTDIDIDQSGKWHWRVFSTGTGQAAEEASFGVRVSKAV